MTPLALSPLAIAAANEIPAATLCVACSGGADSVALLRLLADDGNFCRRLAVLHFDHGARALSSQRDRIFVENLAVQLTIPFFFRRNVNGAMASEDSLRRSRMIFFREIMEHLATPYLLTAHHSGDAVETLLMRLGRGSGLLGLTAPREVQRFRDGTMHLRPLLHNSKKALEEYLCSIGQQWCEDESNRLGTYYRNRIRHELLPLWRTMELGRDIDRAIGSSLNLLREDCDALECLGERLCQLAMEDGGLLLQPLRSEPPAIVRRALHIYFLGCGHCLRKQLAKKVLSVIFAGSKIDVQIARDAKCVSDGAVLRILSDDRKR
ncbi:MAG: tRNA lysidine(34) synthetase TilS [Puniceicoccales bacterium]|nr:tRNA lysidine(34) synthetase TilS [Puniceicoccales bacterium]